MPTALRVNPPVLTKSAEAEQQLSNELKGLAVGAPLATAAAALPGLQSAAALTTCQTVLETARDLLSTELGQYGTKLSAAATQYQQVDGAAGDALGKFTVKYYTV